MVNESFKMNVVILFVSIFVVIKVSCFNEYHISSVGEDFKVSLRCGPYARLRKIGSSTVCPHCLPNYVGRPPKCELKCATSSECPDSEACLNQRCISSCLGTCGIKAQCKVVNHNPICSCPSNYTGDPLTRCVIAEETSAPEPEGPCLPSPCGSNAECKVVNGSSECSCLLDYIGDPPNCKPECIGSEECPDDLACINKKCKDPCTGACGKNTNCTVVSHSPNCICNQGYIGDPLIKCIVQPSQKHLTVCYPSPCGSNTNCTELEGEASCTCLPNYFGDPYKACRPECALNTDCPKSMGCINNQCQDPCTSRCGENAKCEVVNHLLFCYCLPGFRGDPFKYCLREQGHGLDANKTNDRCGPNSEIRTTWVNSTCRCRRGYIGRPPDCRPECVNSAECPKNRACINQNCTDPCPGTCGSNAVCEVVNHNPICSCKEGYSGDSFTSCYPLSDTKLQDVTNPCRPSPCGSFSNCSDVGGAPLCSCLPNYIGYPPNCRPECTSNSECSSNLACIRKRCKDPCEGLCGAKAQCRVINNTPLCTCPNGFAGDPFAKCYPNPQAEADKCEKVLCGSNAICTDGECTCKQNYFGDPLRGCRPPCVLNGECESKQCCNNNKCVDPCEDFCGNNSKCEVNDHSPICVCLSGYKRNGPHSCYKVPVIEIRTACNPSPCGPNSKCESVNDQPDCSCVPGFIGIPPRCRPECSINSDCPLSRDCLNQKCVDPCPGACGIDSHCDVIRHIPICSCPPSYTGDPFLKCNKIEVVSTTSCGPKSQCNKTVEPPSYPCLATYIGEPPKCHPECVSNSECKNHMACINQTCTNPCINTCGSESTCLAISHSPICVCPPKSEGDPLIKCTPSESSTAEGSATKCKPSCGTNAMCTSKFDVNTCTCLPEYVGDPYDGCRPQCILDSDCPSDEACTANKCISPCLTDCTDCQVIRHQPVCAASLYMNNADAPPQNIPYITLIVVLAVIIIVIIIIVATWRNSLGMRSLWQKSLESIYSFAKSIHKRDAARAISNASTVDNTAV